MPDLFCGNPNIIVYVINVTRRFQKTIILRGFFSLFTFVSLSRLFRFKYSREDRGVTLQASDLHRVWISFFCLVLKYYYWITTLKCLRSIHTSINVCVCMCVCVKLQHVYEDVTSSLTQCYHLDANAHLNVDAHVNGPLLL